MYTRRKLLYMPFGRDNNYYDGKSYICKLFSDSRKTDNNLLRITD